MKKITSMQKYEADYNTAEMTAAGNAGLVRRSNMCGCLFCQNIFKAEEAVLPQGSDDNGTALCPHCSGNAVVPDAAGEPISRRMLIRIAHAYSHYHDDDAEYQREMRELDRWIKRVAAEMRKSRAAAEADPEERPQKTVAADDHQEDTMS